MAYSNLCQELHGNIIQAPVAPHPFTFPRSYRDKRVTSFTIPSTSFSSLFTLLHILPSSSSSSSSSSPLPSLKNFNLTLNVGRKIGNSFTSNTSIFMNARIYIFWVHIASTPFHIPHLHIPSRLHIFHILALHINV